ncbi:MAG: hypothetical protein JOS17DRAFT_754709 [Linnemannia elongata]|nr:MAG: hypothetical protein JOS17DRAFT_754709 [Linnemannia elongata]
MRASAALLPQPTLHQPPQFTHNHKDALFDIQAAKISYHQNNPSVSTIHRPSNLNYSQFVESVNRAMNASQDPQSYLFGSVGLTNEELRRINEPIPSIHADVHDATERLENMHLDLYAEWYALQYRSQAPSHCLLSAPPASCVIESRSPSESPGVHCQGPRHKSLSGSTLAVTTGSTYYHADHSFDISPPPEHPRDSVELLTELPPPRLELSAHAYIRVEQDIHIVNHSLESWKLNPWRHLDHQY